MKILFVDGTYEFGGAIISLSFMVKGLLRKDIDVSLVTAQEKKSTRHLFPEITVYQRKPALTFNHRYRLNNALNRLCNSNWHKILLKVYGVAELISSLFYLVQIFLVLLKEKPDVVHLNNNLDQWEAVMAARLAKIPSIVHQRSFPSPSKMMQLSMKWTRRIITISGPIKEDLVSLGCPAQSVETVYNTIDVPVDIHKNGCLEAMDMEFIGERPVCAVFGRVTQWKGQHVFIEAIAEIKKEFSDIAGLIIGDSPEGAADYLDQLKNRVGTLSLQKNIVFTGYQADVGLFYRICDVVVHTSVEPEPFGRTILEAMAYGKPVVATAMGGPLEIIESDYDGVLVPPCNAAVLAETIIRLLKDDKLRAEMGSRARTKVKDRFGVGHQSEVMIEIYNSVLKGDDENSQTYLRTR